MVRTNVVAEKRGAGAALRRVAKAILPRQVKGALKAAQRELLFRRAMRRFVLDPEACARPGHPVLLDLIRGWGNDAWSAHDEYLAACLTHALTARGPILECGSGLSTILVGVVAKMRGQRHVALEHVPEWAKRVRARLRRYLADTVVLCKPLRDYGSFAWYDPAPDAMPDGFSLVICDGPPASTKGGRSGLVPVLRDRLRPGVVILLDDASRDEELAIARMWEAELGASLEIAGEAKPYIRLSVREAPRKRAGDAPASAGRSRG